MFTKETTICTQKRPCNKVLYAYWSISIYGHFFPVRYKNMVIQINICIILNYTFYRLIFDSILCLVFK